MSRGNSSELRQITSLSFSRLRPLILRSRVHMTNIHETWSQGCFHFVAEEATLQMKKSFVFICTLPSWPSFIESKSCSVWSSQENMWWWGRHDKFLNIRRFVCHFTGYVIYFKLETSWLISFKSQGYTDMTYTDYYIKTKQRRFDVSSFCR